MEGILLKLIDNFKLPGIIIAILYLIWQQKFITIIKSSDIERIFFTHEKKQIFRIYNWFALIILTSIMVTFTSFVVYSFFPYYNLDMFLSIDAILNTIFILIIIFSFLLHILKNNKKIAALISLINKNEYVLFILLATIFVIIISSVSFFIAVAATVIKENRDGSIIAISVITSIFLSSFLKSLYSPWIEKQQKLFTFQMDGRPWFIIKLVKDDEFLVGDNSKEEECKEIMFISYTNLKEKIIKIDKIKIDK